MQLDEYMKSAFDYWDGAFSFIDEDSPDGSWIQQHIDTAEFHITEEFAREGLIETVGLPPKGSDGLDIASAYLNELSERQAKEGGDE